MNQCFTGIEISLLVAFSPVLFQNSCIPDVNGRLLYCLLPKVSNSCLRALSNSSINLSHAWVLWHTFDTLTSRRSLCAHGFALLHMPSFSSPQTLYDIILFPKSDISAFKFRMNELPWCYTLIFLCLTNFNLTCRSLILPRCKWQCLWVTSGYSGIFQFFSVVNIPAIIDI